MLSRRRERGETRPLVRACEVVICCWAVRSVRGVCAPSAARRAALFATESVLCLLMCAGAPRGRLRVVGWTKMSTTQLYTDLCCQLARAGYAGLLCRTRLVALTLPAASLNFLAMQGDNGIVWNILSYWRATN